MTGHPLALAVNGREYQLNSRLVAYSSGAEELRRNGRVPQRGPVAIVGLGYVGLPTAFALHSGGGSVIGIDVSPARLDAIRRGDVDLPDEDRDHLVAALEAGTFRLDGDITAIDAAEAVIICVPTPVDEEHAPDLAALSDACTSVAERVRPGQTVILTSTTFVGCTRSLLIEPLARRGLTAGRDVHVAFSPERIDPGNPDHRHRQTPRVVGGVTEDCSARAARVVERMTDSVYLVSSPEAAELTKLYENTFRAVTLALANEFSDICSNLGLDPIEVTIAAGTKPYGFLAGFPGPGVGGHCIPCDPHYLLWQLRRQGVPAPLIEQTMRSIERRPDRVVQRAVQVLTADDLDPAGARVLLAGVSYKAGVADLRESPALAILAGLADHGVDIAYHDPLVGEVRLRHGRLVARETEPDAGAWDLVVIHTVHPGFDYRWVRRCPRVLDATYQFDDAPHRQVV